MRIVRIPMWTVCLMLTVAGVRAGSPIQKAPTAATAKRNPYEGQHNAELAGAKLFARECAACHGTNAQGRDKVPPLRQPEVYRASPGTVFWVLRNGSLWRGMPSFAHLPEPQLWQIVTYVKSLGRD
jgi:mono/diheme cytochrome c family protein